MPWTKIGSALFVEKRRDGGIVLEFGTENAGDFQRIKLSDEELKRLKKVI